MSFGVMDSLPFILLSVFSKEGEGLIFVALLGCCCYHQYGYSSAALFSSCWMCKYRTDTSPLSLLSMSLLSMPWLLLLLLLYIVFRDATQKKVFFGKFSQMSDPLPHPPPPLLGTPRSKKKKMGDFQERN